MSHDEWVYDDLVEVSERLRRGALSSSALTEQMLTRIARLDKQLGAFVHVDVDGARAAARRADEALQAGQWYGPLHGVPVAIKDVIDTAGMPTEAGMKLWRGRVPSEDATCVARLQRAGAVILGKTVTSEAAFIGHSHQPAPRNPWHAAQSSGVSSSGSGVAVAAGLCYAALGTDTGGSIRLPSALNGITGLKPSWGRVSRHGVLPVAPQFDVIGPMTRSVRDAAVVLQAIAGADRHDPITATRPLPNYLEAVEGGIGALRIGVDMTLLADICEAPVLAVLRQALADLEARGARRVEVALPPIDPGVMLKQAHAALASGHRDTYPARATDYGEGMRQSLEAGHQLTAVELSDAVNAGLTLRAQIDALFDEVDLLLMPVIATAVEPAGPPAMPDMELALRRATATMAFSITGHPTLTLPAGLIDGLPTALQLVARPFDEALLLRAGQAWQQHTSHHRERPPLS